jgi:hypothetical protein
LLLKGLQLFIMGMFVGERLFNGNIHLLHDLANQRESSA